MRFTLTRWVIVAIAFVVFGFCRGLHSSFGVFYVALLDTFGWSRGATAGVFSFVLAIDATLSPVAGYLLDRYDPRRIVAAGCLTLAAGLFLSSHIQTLPQFYLFFGLVCAIGFTFTGMVPHVFLISRWFFSNRASALGVVYAGTGIGILLLAPLSERLMATWGWRGAFQALAVAVLLGLLPVVWIFYQQGLAGEKPESKKEPRTVESAWTAKLALRSLQFWLLFIARVCAASGTTVIVTHQVAHVVDAGYSRLFAASIFGLVGVTSTCGRMIFGFIADLLSKQAAYTLNILSSLIGVGALIAVADASRTWLLYVYVVFFGIGFGSRAVIFSALTADIFSGKGFGAILGYSTVAVGVGGAVGSWFGGALHDWTGSYLGSFAISSLVLAGSDLCIWLAANPWVAAYDERLSAKRVR